MGAGTPSRCLDAHSFLGDFEEQSPATEDEGRQEFDFILAERLVKLEALPEWREAREAGWLVRRTVFLKDVARRGAGEDTLVVSHRWIERDHPDPRGAQMRKVKQYLREHPGIKEVWIDFSCLPQGRRSASQRQFFKSCLKAANMLYLGFNILVIVDAAYCARFWTQFECFLSMRRATCSGLELEVGNSRAHFVGDGQYEEDASLVVQDLRRRWGDCSVEKAYDMLARDDVAVTNQGDKEVQLKKLMDLEERIRHLWSEEGVDRAVEAAAADTEARPKDSADLEAEAAAAETEAQPKDSVDLGAEAAAAETEARPKDSVDLEAARKAADESARKAADEARREERAGWEVAWSARHKRWFFQDRLSGASSWSRPPGCAAELPDGAPLHGSTGTSPGWSAPLHGSRGRSSAPLPPGWESEWDATHQLPYYFNRRSGERRWRPPS